MRTVEWKNGVVRMIDQRELPRRLVVAEFSDYREVAKAIREMVVRGAPAIGAAAAFGLALAARKSPARTRGELLADLEEAAEVLRATRPTAVNLSWAIERMLARARSLESGDVKEMARTLEREAQAIADEDVETNRRMGAYGAELIEDGDNILTHCNTGALATVDYGTALGVIRTAHEQGKRIHVWVDETRPRLQGARLTAWELGKHGIPHTIITDNAGGHLMQHGMVDLVIVGTDRTTRTGDVANKIGTYLKALAARDNGIPFWVALPSSTFDRTLRDGIKEIPIEEREPGEIRYVQGKTDHGAITRVLVPPENSPAANHAFDVTPARLVTGFITERGRCSASEEGITTLFPEFNP